MTDNPYFYWVLIADIIIIGGVIIYVARDVRAKRNKDKLHDKNLL